jgi:ubiquinone/menaquinone biosynthesis C-methylase UbiE
MQNFWKRKVERLIYLLNGKDKEFAEIKFWRRQIGAYLKWYNGECKELYGHPSPVESQKIRSYKPEIAALLTFFEIHQKEKYKRDLLLNEDDFVGMKVLDVGSGPFPSALCFKDCEVYSLDPLIDSYVSAGYPLHCYDSRGKFVCAQAENIPFEDGFFDAVVSVNAIDHVNDFAATAMELKRVLKTGGKFRMHVHYHPKTKAEPLELNDEIFIRNYSWVNGIKKWGESKQKVGTQVVGHNELFVVWGN